MRNPEDSLSYLFTQIGKHHRTKSNALLNNTGIHAGQEMLLYQLIQEDGQTITGLAKVLFVKPATLSNMADRMLANGLVEKRAGTIDKRKTRLFITDKGREAYKTVSDAWDSIESKTTRGLSVLDKFMLKRLLDRVLNNLS